MKKDLERGSALARESADVLERESGQTQSVATQRKDNGGKLSKQVRRGPQSSARLHGWVADAFGL